MAEIKVEIGGRTFEVACRSGEEHFLKSAAAMLNNEAAALNDALGRMPETRMLLMAGLMLADKTASLEDQLQQSPQAAGGGVELVKRAKQAERQLANSQASLAEAQAGLAEAKASLAETEAAKVKTANQLDALQKSYKGAILTMGKMVKKVETAATALNKVG